MTAGDGDPGRRAPANWGRRALLAGVGVAAAAGGVIWQGRNAPAPSASAADGSAQLWEHRFPLPEGGELVMADKRGRPLLINFWATWCPPCVKELPEIDRFARGHGQRLSVVGLAIDSADPVRAFLQRMPLSFDIGLAGLAGSELARGLGNPGGMLPFTVLIGADGKVLQRKLGETTHDELVAWAHAL
jgi:thiol-disulfide isomerase/thioredoxin